MELVVTTLVGHVIGSPQRGDGLEHLGHPSSAFAVRDPERGELRFVPAYPDAEHGAAAGQHVEGRPFLRERDRVAERQDEDHGAESHRAGHASEGAEQCHRLEPRHPVGRRCHEQVIDEHRGLEPEILGMPKIRSHVRK